MILRVNKSGKNRHTVEPILLWTPQDRADHSSMPHPIVHSKTLVLEYGVTVCYRGTCQMEVYVRVVMGLQVPCIGVVRLLVGVHCTGRPLIKVPL